ncbi:MAG: glycoside hydrolase family 43 protein [Nitrospirota bacterium]
MVSGIVRVLVCAFFITTSLIAAGSAGENTYTNPVLVEIVETESSKPNHFSGPLGIGDPAVIFHEGKYYLYPTGDNRGYDVYISSDLVHWEKGPRVFHSGEKGAWAPDVLYNPDDRKFYLYYAVNRKIGVALSDRAGGNFEDLGILTDGAIDANMFRDEDGRYYLYYAAYPSFEIYVQPMDGPLKKKGKPVRIIKPTESWEMKNVPITEAPWMLKHNGTYYLLYSGGSADMYHYAVGYATSKSPVGPFTKYPGNPIMKSGDGVFGPGHASVTSDRSGKLWMVYHQQRDSTKGWDRMICIDPIRFDESGVLRGRATRGSPQPAPVTE